MVNVVYHDLDMYSIVKGIGIPEERVQKYFFSWWKGKMMRTKTEVSPDCIENGPVCISWTDWGLYCSGWTLLYRSCVIKSDKKLCKCLYSYFRCNSWTRGWLRCINIHVNVYISDGLWFSTQLFGTAAVKYQHVMVFVCHYYLYWNDEYIFMLILYYWYDMKINYSVLAI